MLKNRLSLLPRPKSYSHIFPAIFFSVLLLSGCQKNPEQETSDELRTETVVQTEPVTSNINGSDSDDTNINVDNATDPTESSIKTEQDINLTELENDLGTTDTSANNTDATPNPEQAIKGAQITDVNYRSATGETLFVVFETSAKGVLNAIVTLPNKPKITLSAPEGQGNNPTYRSADGSMELISHGGGSTIDLMRNDKLTSYDAISADAEVITE
ncbi:MAG: hypothetical protein ACTH8Z_07385 [Psychrobacter sp.]|uniref:hypothetical protein n=1 Tax=Psychrobacter sp. AOP3-A1-26 TaxID=3457700 RepID=UPI0026512D21|nr:hypothetical protein [Psychrobacter sp.]MDN5898337.1 hypothetical protein [Psychrobacter sp.]